jgi:hypothetical protein
VDILVFGYLMKKISKNANNQRTIKRLTKKRRKADSPIIAESIKTTKAPLTISQRLNFISEAKVI